MVLSPFDEVRNDEEVAGKIHIDDDVEFKIQAIPVFLLGGNSFCGRQPVGQPFMSLASQLIGFAHLTITGPKAWKDRIPGVGPISTSAGDFDRIFNSFRQVVKQLHHLCLTLEIVLRGQAPTIRLNHISTG